MYELGDYSVPAISVTAARGTDGRLYASVVNLNPDESADVTLEIEGSRVRDASAEILTGDDTDSHNSFDAPNTIRPEPFSDFSIGGGELTLELPAKSIVMISLE
jgi:alpha-N-arabinofuranosidase